MAIYNKIISTMMKNAFITGLIPIICILISKPHSLSNVFISAPPLASWFLDVLDCLVLGLMLEFHHTTRSTFVNPYPYFSYNDNTIPYMLACGSHQVFFIFCF